MTKRLTPTLLICSAASLAVVFGLTLPAQTNPATPQAPSPYASDQTPASGSRIDIVDFAFTGTFQLAPGQPFQLTNRDSVAHTLTARDGSFDSGTVGAGAAASLTAPALAGTYQFICQIHPSMTGSLEVQP